MKSDYGHDFYVDRHQKTVHSARVVLTLLLRALPPVHSAIDFGCGVGTWLSVLQEKGVSTIRGLDGPWVEQELLEIPKEDFRVIDFEESIAHERRYDLAMTLEVAEHISRASAGDFIDSLVAASDIVLFSAAIPYQGGVGHVNEQWPEFWVGMFTARGYVPMDFLRREIWNDDGIPYWYRQNILLFVKEEKVSGIRVDALGEAQAAAPIGLVHPELYLSRMGRMTSVGGSFGLFLRAVRSSIKAGMSKQG